MTLGDAVAWYVIAGLAWVSVFGRFETDDHIAESLRRNGVAATTAAALFASLLWPLFVMKELRR